MGEHAFAALDDVVSDLNQHSGSEPVTALTVALGEPPWGLGFLISLSLLVETVWPARSALDRWGLRVLARRGAAVEVWTARADLRGGAIRLGDHVESCSPADLALHRSGPLVRRATWAAHEGWIARRLQSDWDAVAAP